MVIVKNASAIQTYQEPSHMDAFLFLFCFLFFVFLLSYCSQNLANVDILPF